MTDTQFAMVSEWMFNGNINDFVKANPDADRLVLVGFPCLAVNASLIIVQSSSWEVSRRG